MDTLRLAKHHGLGNDFLVVLLSGDEKASLERLVDNLPELAREVCHRRTGIGADGLILGTDLRAVPPSSAPDALETASAAQVRRVQMKLYNSDGSSAEVSGNGLACLANEVAHCVLSSTALGEGTGALKRVLELTVDTVDGARRVTLDAEVVPTENGSLAPIRSFAEVHMPNVVPGPAIAAELGKQIDESFGINQRDTGDVGNPHLVINAGRPMDADETARLGAAFETHFPEGINVEFIWCDGPGDSPSAVPTSIGMSVWERGAGLTQACGTGAVTAAVRARDWGLVEPSSQTVVEMPGGNATITTDGDDGHPVLNVPVAHISDHEWPLHATPLDA